MSINLRSSIAFILFAVVPCMANAQSTVNVVNKHVHVPVLKRNNINPVLRITVAFPAPPMDESISAVRLNFSGTDDLKDIDSVHVFYQGNSSRTALQKSTLFGIGKPDAKNLVIIGNAAVLADSAFFTVSIMLTAQADLHRKIGVRCSYIELEKAARKVASKKSPPVKQRIGIALRKHNDDQVHTYRIPGLTTTNSGTLLGVFDSRRESSRDLQGDIDIGLVRSTDGGSSWEPTRTALDMGTWGGLPEKFNGVSDACILTDRNTGRIFLAGLWMHGVLDDKGAWIEGLTNESQAWNHQWRNKGSQPGFDVKQTAQFLITSSSDDGKTWSKPVNLTSMCKREEWWLWAPAPGHGITLENGTLIFPTQGRDKDGLPFSNITYSSDGGQTWKTSEPGSNNTTENEIVQLSDGSIMQNARYNTNRTNLSDSNGRRISITTDMGATWKEHPTSRSALIESTCMASIHKHVYKHKGKERSLLLFSNPNTKTGRHHMTIKVSLDDGKTWPEKYWLLLDEGNSRGYSCITSVNENTIGILYEGSGADMVFESIPLKEILRR